MNLYITFSDRNKIKKCFLNLRKYLIISVDEVIESVGYGDKKLDDCSYFLVNEEIKKLIREGSARRKLLAIVYTNPTMDGETVRELIHYANSLHSVQSVIFLVEKGQKEEFYELFEEVLFYPMTKKVHIVECTPVPVDWLDKSEKVDGNLFLS